MELFTPPSPRAVDRSKAAGVFAATFYNRNFGVMGAAMHQRRVFVPLGGQHIRIRFIYEVPQSVAAWEVAAHAVTSGRQFDEIDPKKPDGSAATWQVGAAFTTAAGSGGGAQELVESYSPWYTLYVYPDATHPKWGTIVMRSRNTTANAGRGRVFTGSNGRLNLANNVAVRYRDVYEYAAAATAIDAPAITLTSLANLDDSARNITAFQFEIETLQPSTLITLTGDSRPQGEGSTSNLWGWMARAIEQLWIEGVPVGYEFHGRQGFGHASFHAMIMDRLAKTGRRLPDIAIMQPSSTNGSTWTEAQVNADIARNLEFVSRCRQLGVQPVFMSMHPSTSATTADGVANWRTLNQALLASGVPLLDFYSRPELTNGLAIPALPTNTGITADAGHLNDAGQELEKNVLVLPRLKQLLGLAP